MKTIPLEFLKPYLDKLKSGIAVDRYAVGLNLGFSTVKVAKLHLLKDKVELCGFHLAQNQMDMEETLRAIIRELDIKTVNFSLSGQQAIIRYVDFPKLKSEELKQSLKFEAQKYIPFPAADVNIDGCILRDDLPDNKMRVLLAAVKKDLLEQRLKLLRSVGLDVNVVEIDSISLINAFNFNYADDETVKNKSIALLNIGSATSNLNILDQGQPALSRDIPIGGNNLTQRIAEALGVDFKTAEAAKTGADKQHSEKIAGVIETVLAKLAHEARSSFDYYESRSVASVEKIFISGGASLYDGVKDMMMGYLGMPVENWDPYRKIAIASTLDAKQVQTVGGQLAVAIGLALRG
ncbi:MAG TPA: type IV pilus assembly protein PilM [Candidatus Omnitrophota bacterium]|nr:type IV pilus assembly protein PilM [Candidatus Omnitrophota bacterium]HRZ15587.1 type IV pilus assembly protein PilM [Candidatus Omnitrophota bacterium]